MSVLSIIRLAAESGGTSSISKSYNAIQSVRLSYLVKSNATDITLAMREALAADDGITRVPQYLERCYRTQQQYATSHEARHVRTDNEGNYYIQIDVGFSGGALLESGFLLQARCSGETERRNTDYLGQPLVVSYTAPGSTTTDTQVGEADVYSPVADFTAMGLYQTSEPISEVVKTWLGKVNSNPVFGFESREVLCTAVDFEPHDLAVSPAIYKFNFTFRAKPSQYWGLTRLFPWDAKILYKDAETQLPPPDVSLTNGFAQHGLYEAMDFATTAPIGVPEEA